MSILRQAQDKSQNKKFYITTSIAYTNAPPHIGFALELVQADVLARYHRLLGDDVFFLTGTDEHGFKIVEAAEKEGKTPEVFVEEISEKFRQLTRILNISNKGFIRTTDKKRHWPVVEDVWKKLEQNGDIELRDYEGLYCSGCEAFVREKDLIDGKCPNHLKKPELVKEKNYFFKLKKYANRVKEEIEDNKIKIIPDSRKNEILSFIREEVEDVSFSRPIEKLSWGIPVPTPQSGLVVGGRGSTIYVWADALLNYISGLGSLGYISGTKNVYWPPDVQCIGKDILRFHALIWPAILIALDLPRPKTIFVHGFITADGQKMSKSLGNVIDPFELVKKYGADAVRYFLLREISSTEDGDFTLEKFEKIYNADLVGGIGNLLARSLTLVEKYCNTIVPKVDISKTGLNRVNRILTFCLKESVTNIYNSIPFFLKESFEFNTALFSINDLLKRCDAYIDEYKLYKPEDVLKNDKEKINIALYDILETLRHVAWMLLPFMPETADKIFIQLGLDPVEEKRKSYEDATKWGGLKSGTKIKKGVHLFEKFI